MAPHTRHHIHVPAHFGESAADAVAAAMGSWRFIIAQSIVVGAWITLNLLALVHHWDVYPFILLNLLFSTQAAYAAPIIMMSQNRAAAKDRRRDDHEAEEVSALLTLNTRQLALSETAVEILKGNTTMLNQHTDELAILTEIRSILKAPKDTRS